MFEKCNFSLEYAANYTVLYSDAPILMLISVAWCLPNYTSLLKKLGHPAF